MVSVSKGFPTTVVADVDRVFVVSSVNTVFDPVSHTVGRSERTYFLSVVLWASDITSTSVLKLRLARRIYLVKSTE